MKRIAMIVAVAALVLSAGVYGAFALLSGGGFAPVELSASDPSTSSDANLDGDWTLSSPESFVGYRVREKLAFLPAPNDAVGRTTALSGSMKIGGLGVTSVDVAADLRELRSDRAMRDRRIRELGIETDRFPEARFVTASPISFGERPASGRGVRRTVAGRLTLHGVTRDVRVPIRGQWTNDRIEVVGSLNIRFAAYDIERISLRQVTTEDHGTIEFRLVFVPA